MKKQIFSSLATFSLITALFMSGCERTRNTDEIPQATPDPIAIPVDTLSLDPITPDTLSQAALDSIAVADSVALSNAEGTVNKGTSAAAAKSSTTKSTTKTAATKSTTKTSTSGAATSTGTSTSTKSTGGSSSTTTSTQSKGSGTGTGTSSGSGSGTGTSTSTQSKGSNP